MGRFEEDFDGLWSDSFGSRIAQVRRMAGLRQHDVARAVGVSRSLISAFENDQRQPTLALTVELARTLGVTVDDLLSTVASARAGRAVTVRSGCPTGHSGERGL